MTAAADNGYRDRLRGATGTAHVRLDARFAQGLRDARRYRVYLLGMHAPKRGPLIDTKTYHCDGAAGSWYCKGSYEALPPGTYTFRVVFATSAPTNPGGLELTITW